MIGAHSVINFKEERDGPYPREVAISGAGDGVQPRDTGDFNQTMNSGRLSCPYAHRYQSLFTRRTVMVWINTRMGTQRHAWGRIPSALNFLQVITSPLSSLGEREKGMGNKPRGPACHEHGTCM